MMLCPNNSGQPDTHMQTRHAYVQYSHCNYKFKEKAYLLNKLAAWHANPMAIAGHNTKQIGLVIIPTYFKSNACRKNALFFDDTLRVESRNTEGRDGGKG
jgi:hypothetical protein